MSAIVDVGGNFTHCCCFAFFAFFPQFFTDGEAWIVFALYGWHSIALREIQTIAWTATDFRTDAFFAYISIAFICCRYVRRSMLSHALVAVLSAIKNIWISKGITRVSMCHRLYLNLPTIIIHGSIAAHSTHIRTITSERFVFVWVENARLACHIINTRSKCNVVISPLFTSVDQFFFSRCY